MVEQVVTRSDRVEHRTHGLSGRGFVGDASGFGSGVVHQLRRSRAWASMYTIAASNSPEVTSSTTPASPIPMGKTKRRTPPTFFLSAPVAAMSFGARSLRGGNGP